MVVLGSLLSALATIGFGIFYWFGGTPVFFGVNFLAAGAFILVAAARPVAIRTRIYAAVTVGLVLFGIQLTLVADINNGITPWLLVPSIGALIIGDRRITVYATAIAFLEPGLVVAATLAGLLHPVAVLPYPNLLMLLSILGVIGICGSFAYTSHKTRARLQYEVDARTSALKTALDAAHQSRAAAVAAAEAKDKFFANLTHEIRTPLTGIAGSAELLAEGDLSGEQRQFADALLASTRSLTQLVNAMLDHARLAAGHTTLDTTPVDVREIGHDLAGLYGLPAEDRGLAFEVVVADSMPAVIETDGIRLRQVLANLVANALKFTEHGSVRVELGWTPDGDAAGMLIAAVADTGPGIAPDQHDAVFEAFVQGDASIRRAHGGTGLGLAISRQLAELLGGTLELASELGAGSTFTLRIPATVPIARDEGATAGPFAPSESTASGHTGEDGQRQASGTSAAAGPLQGLRVLLAEDNELNRAVAAAMLRRAGVTVVPAIDGREAVALAASAEVDLVLMDLQMPGVDGIEATRQIRAAEVQNGSRRLPIVAMTGNALEDYGEACEAAGMDAFVMKPVTSVELRTVVERTMAGA
jgi:signal transduction histidine kinase/ActR/RegA family two-component response regulator